MTKQYISPEVDMDRDAAKGCALICIFLFCIFILGFGFGFAVGNYNKAQADSCWKGTVHTTSTVERTPLR